MTLISSGGPHIYDERAQHGQKRPQKVWLSWTADRLSKRCCTYVNTGHCRKIHQDTGLCVLCIQYVCVRACECVCVRLCVCVFVLVRPLAWERYTQDCSTRTLSLARYILYGVKLKPNTHQNETTTESEANRIRRTEGKSSLETLWHLHTGNLYNCIEMPTHHPLNFKGKGNPWLWIKQHNLVSRLLYHGRGGKNWKK